MPAHAHYDALVIGAGMSGLAAGIRLAHFGKRVAVLERHSLWGGLNSFFKLRGRRYDVGLHALTNYAPKGARELPLGKVLRQLRLKHDELRLGEQRFSEIRFPGLHLTFSNEFARLESEVARAFPRETDGFARLVRDLRALPEYAPSEVGQGAREVLGGYLRDPLLVDALLLPICYYGSARENDVDWYQFVVLFKSLFLEGLARPEGGIKTLLDLLVRRYREAGGELRMRTGVARVVVEGGRARGVVLDDGTELEAERVFSSAGLVETKRLCGTACEREAHGRLSFLETIRVLDREPASYGHEAAVTFFNASERFAYRRPDGLADDASGVICSPNNYAASEPLAEGFVRVTLLANATEWAALAPGEYAAEKARWSERALDAASRFVPDPRPFEKDRDSFTPCTIERFTGHLGGAVYGSPTKRLDGDSGVENLHLIGTDQGLLGVVGALLSGITVANRHGLAAPAAPVPLASPAP